MFNTGKEIFNQLKCFKLSLMCWGASSYKVFRNSDFNSTLGNHEGGLLFKVRGLKHKGHVAIVLNGKDLYNISIGRFVKGQFIVKTTMNDIYCDSLESVIDSLVEGTLDKSPQQAQEIYKKSGVLFFG